MRCCARPSETRRALAVLVLGAAAAAVPCVPLAQETPAPPVALTATVTEGEVELSTATLPPLVVPVEREQAAGIETIMSEAVRTSLLLTRDRSSAVGYVEIDGQYYRIETVDGQLVLRPSDGATEPYPEYARVDDLIVDQSQMITLRPSPGEPHALMLADNVVDIAFFYDEEMVTAGGAQAPHLQAQAAIDYLNAAYRTHEVSVEARVVYVGPFPADFTFSPLSALTTNAEALAIGDRFGADLLHGLYKSRGQNYCGIAYLLGRYGVSSHTCGDLSRIIAHEIGHNFGMNHDRANAGLSNHPEIGGFSFGFVCNGAGTIMSYPGFPRLPFYSSPLLNYQGAPCGIPVGQPNAAFNAHVLTFTSDDLARLRPVPASYGTVTLSSAASPLVLQEENGAPLVVDVVRTGDTSRTASVSIAAIGAAAVEGKDFEPFSTRIEFAAFEDRKSVQIKALDDEEYEPPELLDVVLRYPLGIAIGGDKLTLEIRGADPNRGKAQFANTAVSVWEAAKTVNVEVKRIESAENTLNVAYETYNISALAGEDYVASAGELVFAAGETSKTIAFTINDDTLLEGYNTYRQFGVRLMGTHVVSPSNFVVSIFNDDVARGRAVFAKATLEVSEDAQQIVLRVNRVDAFEDVLTAKYEVAGVTAVSGRHFIAQSGPVQFANNQRTQVVALTLINDSTYEADRTLKVTVTDPAGGSPSVANVTITDDDPNRGTARFASASANTNENEDAVLEVVREPGLTHELKVLYRTEGGTATAGSDYVSSTGSVTFAPGQSTANLRIDILTDTLTESAETFRVVLFGAVSNPSAAEVRIGNVQAQAARFVSDTPNPAAAPATAASSGGSGSAGILELIALALLACVGRIRRRGPPTRS